MNISNSNLLEKSVTYVGFYFSCHCSLLEVVLTKNVLLLFILDLVLLNYPKACIYFTLFCAYFLSSSLLTFSRMM